MLGCGLVSPALASLGLERVMREHDGGFIDLAPTTPATTVLESRADARAAR